MTQYAAWQQLRERALRNAPGGKMPSGYVEPPRAPPPPPSAIDDADIMDLSFELNAASIEDVPGDLDEQGIERVPMADPGLDVRMSKTTVEARPNLSRQRPLPIIGQHEHSSIEQGLHTRRKSVLPGNAHRLAVSFSSSLSFTQLTLLFYATYKHIEASTKDREHRSNSIDELVLIFPFLVALHSIFFSMEFASI